MTETIDTSVLGQCEMMLRDVVQKNKAAVAGLEQLEVFRRVDARLPKLLEEDEVLKLRILDKKKEIGNLDSMFDEKVKVIDDRVGIQREKINDKLVEYQQVVASEVKTINNAKGQAQADYISMKAGLSEELKEIRGMLQVAKRELQDAEGAIDAVKQGVRAMAQSVGVSS